MYIKKTGLQRTLKRSEKVHPPAKLSSISFERQHPENDQHHSKRPRSLFDPRAANNRNVEIDRLGKTKSSFKRNSFCSLF